MLSRSVRVVGLSCGVLIGLACGGQPTDPASDAGLEASRELPFVEEFEPTSAMQGSRVALRVSGENFDLGSRVDLLLSGNTVNEVQTLSTQFVTGEQLVADISIAADAPVGAYQVQVTTSEGKRGIPIEDFVVVVGGSLQVAVATSGEPEDLDPNGYTLTVDASSRSVAVNDTTTFDPMAAGPHLVRIDGLAAHCTVEGENPRTVTVAGGAVAQTSFMVACVSALPPQGVVRGRLAFVRAGDIYIYDPTNESTVQLTSGGNFGYPAWSPDGSRIAFAQTNPWPDTDKIYAINADGSGLQLVGEGRSPVWSPDGRRIALAAWHNGQGAIFVKSVDDPSQSAVRIGFDRGVHDFPAWSPDGTRIAFVSDWMAYDFALDVFIANADGSGEVQQVTDGFTGNNGHWSTYAQPSWSPDGSSVAVVTCYEWQFTSCTSSQVGVMEVDGSGFRLLANTTGFARPGWAPDGSAVVFSRTCWEHNCPSAIFEMAPDGTNERLLIEDAHSGVFSP